jgi:hypothetical protein
VLVRHFGRHAGVELDALDARAAELRGEEGAQVRFRGVNGHVCEE